MRKYFRKFIQATSHKLQTACRLSDGQLLAEILIALAAGGLFILGATIAILSVIRYNFENRGNQVAASVAFDQANRIDSFSDSVWHNIYNLSKGVSNSYYLISSSTASVAVSGQESALFNDVTSGLVGHWKFDEASGLAAYDSSGNFLNGTLTNGPTRTASSSCQMGSCLGFNGTSNYVNFTSSGVLNITGNQTISLWVKSSTAVTNADIAGRWLSSVDNKKIWRLRVDGTLLTFRVSADGIANSSDATTTISSAIDGNWHHIVAMYDGSSIGVYIDGTLRGSTVYSGGLFSDVGSILRVGASSSGGGIAAYFEGIIDDVRIYNRALSAAEIKQLYSSAPYSKYFYVENVGRDGNGNIVTSGGTDDPSTQKISSVVSWQDGRQIVYPKYVTRKRNFAVVQTDWKGGSGEEGPLTLIGDKFSASSNITASSSLVLATSTSSGNLTSSIFDSQSAGGAALNSILWQGTRPSGTGVQFHLAFSNSSSGPWTYVGPDGTGTTYYTPTANNISLKISNAHNYRYFRYRVFLNPSGGQSPTVDDVVINWSP